MARSRNVDVVVVGGGIAGAALATVLARGGVDVVVLERDTAYRDKVRGEVFHLWGVLELRRLGLEQVLLEAGGGYATRYARFDEWLAPSEAEAQAIPAGNFLPGAPGWLTVGHPEACEALARAAEEAGATVVRGVGAVELTLGSDPIVAYRHDDDRQELACRMVVGADGRHSVVRRHVGIALHETQAATIGGGMLVDGLTAWPEDLAATATEGDLLFLAFPRPGGRVRLYLLWSVEQKGRFTGPDRQRQFLDACRLRSLPYGAAIAASRPAGPCSSYPMNDSWCDRIVDDGVVLVGDAAGWNDPIIGQGLSIAARDARMVSEVLLGGTDWSPGAFQGYAEERAERLRRLRIAARMSTVVRASFGPGGVAFRRWFAEQAQHDQRLLGHFVAAVIGPERVPDEIFTEATFERILAGRDASATAVAEA